MTNSLRTTLNYLVDVMISLEKQFGLGSGFLLSLREEDDWSFIVKRIFDSLKNEMFAL